MGHIADIAGRARLLVELEAGARHYPKRLRRRSFTSLPSRWFAAASGRRRTQWLSHPFAYEVRFDSILMHVHRALILQVLPHISLPPGARVLDVGGNVGQFGVALMTMRPDVRLTSLEPNPSCREVLDANAATRPGWDVVAAGLSCDPGSTTLWFVPGRSGQGSVHKRNANLNVVGAHEDSVREVSVDFISADTMCTMLADGTDAFDLVKVDVEGYERMVLPEIARLHWRYLLIEVGEGRDGGVSDADAQGLLADAGVAVRALTSTRTGDEPIYDVLYERVGPAMAAPG